MSEDGSDSRELLVVRFGEPSPLAGPTRDALPVFEHVCEADSFEELRERVRNQTRRSEAWRRAGLWVLDQLSAVLGEDWPGKVRRSGSSEWFPGELGYQHSHTIAYAKLLELALRLQKFEKSDGIRRVRRDLRDDRTPGRWHHTMMLLELAALAQAQDVNVLLESAERGTQWPADVVVANGRKRKVIYLGVREYFVMGDNQNRSCDSRDVGLITRHEIKGKVIATIP